jgi:hypothetical protein
MALLLANAGVMILGVKAISVDVGFQRIAPSE